MPEILLPPLPAQLTDNYAALISREVNWGDLDAANHVNNTVYVKWAESGRIAYWQLAEMPIRQDIGPVVARVSAKYIFPLQFPDRIWMGTRMLQMRGEMFFLETLIVSERHQRVACLVEISGVMFDYKQQVKAPPLEGMEDMFRKVEEEYLGKAAPYMW